jgi:type I restriction enzyme S subunit
VNPYINFSDLARFEFSLPPIDEQWRIGELLRAATETVETQTEALDALKIARRATIDHTLSMSHGLNFVRLETVAAMQNGRPFPGDEYGGDGVKLLRPGNLGVSGYFYWGEGKSVSLDPSWADTASDFLIAPGDVVINLTAQSLEDGFMGRVCLAREADESLLNQRIGRFRCDESTLLPEYLFRCLQTSRFRQHAHANCEGSKVKHLFWQHLAKYEIPLPPLTTQREIAAQCAEVDQAIAAFRDRLGKSKTFQSQLVNEFVGEV